MAKEISNNSLSVFEQIKNTYENGNEFWWARQLAKVLDYTDFRNFTGVIEKAAEACKKSGQQIADHRNRLAPLQSIGIETRRHLGKTSQSI